MMPGIAIQSGFPIAAAPAIRTATAMSDEHFSQALDGKPKTPASEDGKSDASATAAAPADNGAVDEAGHPDKDDKVGKATGKDDQDDDDKDADKDDDKDGGALPVHMQVERVLAQQWPAAGQAGNPAPSDSGTAGASTDASVPQGAGTDQVNGAGLLAQAAATATPASAIPAPSDAKVTPAVPAMTGQLPVTPSPTGMAGAATPAKPDNASEPAQATALAQPDGDTAPGVSVQVAASSGAASPSAAFLAKVAALDHGGKPASAQQQPSATSPASARDALPNATTMPAGPGAGDANADTDGKGEGDTGGEAQNKSAQNVAAPSASAKEDASSPAPTAQMVPSSGSATSFASALADSGRMARYVTAAATAAAAGAPPASLPVQSLSIQLRPVELGAVTANLKYSGGGLSIDIQVETSEAQRRLSSDSSDIVKSLQSLGFQVDKVTVRQVQVQTQAQGQGQPQGQPMGRDSSAGSFGGQGGNAFSAQGQSDGQAGRHRQGSESRYEDAAERSIGAVQPASDRMAGRGVYI